MDLIESFATATFPYDPLKQPPLHPVTFYNIKTQVPVKIDVMPDTGATASVLDMKYAKLLGIDESNSQPSSILGIGDKERVGFVAQIPMRIANLAPVAVHVNFIPNMPTNVLGRMQGLSHYRTTFTWEKLYYEELFAKQQELKLLQIVKKAVGLANSYVVLNGRRR